MWKRKSEKGPRHSKNRRDVACELRLTPVVWMRACMQPPSLTLLHMAQEVDTAKAGAQRSVREWRCKGWKRERWVMNASVVLRPLMCVFVFMCVWGPPSTVCATVRSLLLITCKGSTPAASTHRRSSVRPLHGTKSVRDGFAPHGMRQQR